MSNITTIYDQIINTTLPGLYGSGYSRIPDAYDLLDNSDLFLRQGYGLKIGPGNPEELEFKSKWINQSFSVVLTREIIKLEEDATYVDTAIKAMLEDVNSGQKIFYNNNQLGIESNIEKIDLGGVSPIEYFKGDKKNFISIEYEIIITIREDL